jgi:hypothetical protein
MGWLATPRSVPFIRLTLVVTAWLTSIALPLVIWDAPIPPKVHFISWRLVSTGGASLGAKGAKPHLILL